MNYYEANFQAYIENTLNLDMSDLYSEFKLPPRSRVLDIGCGAGRDLKFFKDRGHDCLGLEPSEKLAAFARQHSGCEVIESGIMEFNTDKKFEGVWACASLLHLSDSELETAFSHINRMMHQGSLFYCSFKRGCFKGQRAGRFYNDQTLESLTPLITPEFVVSKSWITQDPRANHEEEWLNLILTQNGYGHRR